MYQKDQEGVVPSDPNAELKLIIGLLFFVFSASVITASYVWPDATYETVDAIRGYVQRISSQRRPTEKMTLHYFNETMGQAGLTVTGMKK